MNEVMQPMTPHEVARRIIEERTRKNRKGKRHE